MKDSHQPFVPWDVMREHLEDAGFFWQLWRQARQGYGAWPAHVVEGHEVLLHGHLEALGAALATEGAALADRLLWPMLAAEAADDEVAFAAAFVLATGAVRSDGAGVRGALIERLGAAEGGRREALVAALGLAVCPGLDDDLAAVFVGGGPPAAAVARVLAVRDPARALALLCAAGTDDPALTLVALGAASQAGSHDGVELVARHLSSARGPAAAIHEAARFAGVSLGVRAAWQVCRADAEAGDPEALALLAPGEENATVALLLEASLDPARAAAACLALGFSGQLPLADRCVELMFEPATARRAAEAFSFITGIELVGPLVRQFDDAEAVPATLPDDPLEGSPWPEADAVAAHWLRVRQRFSPGVRYLCGRPLDQAALLGALRAAPGARQDLLALELGLRSRGLIRLPPLGWWRARLERLAVPVAVPAAAFEAPLASFMTL